MIDSWNVGINKKSYAKVLFFHKLSLSLGREKYPNALFVVLFWIAVYLPREGHCRVTLQAGSARV